MTTEALLLLARGENLSL